MSSIDNLTFPMSSILKEFYAYSEVECVCHTVTISSSLTMHTVFLSHRIHKISKWSITHFWWYVYCDKALLEVKQALELNTSSTNVPFTHHVITGLPEASHEKKMIVLIADCCI